MFSTAKRRIYSSSEKTDIISRNTRSERATNPIIAGSTDMLMREMPLQMMNEFLNQQDVMEEEEEMPMEQGDSEDGFELYGEDEDVAV